MEEENEKVVEETTQVNQQDPGDENITKAKPIKTAEDNITKVNLSQPVSLEEQKNDSQDNETVEEIEDTSQALEEVVEEQNAAEEKEIAEVEEKVEEAVAVAQATGKPLPENIQKLVDFMGETGGDINDYVKLNQDYSKLDDNALLREYYNQTKPHLDNEEINFLMEDTFSYDEDVDDDREITKKKIALKEQVASAKSHLDGQKSKYYEEIKMGSKLPSEAQKAMDFFNRYNKETEEISKSNEINRNNFTLKTNKVFNDKFKGFEYDVGDKKYRFNVKDVDKVKAEQSDINQFMTKFVDENSALKDAKGYHKALFTASNTDAIAKHFYEQGKVDAMKDSVANAKNVDMSPRQAHGTIESGGLKVKVLGESSSDFKFKIKNNKFKN